MDSPKLPERVMLGQGPHREGFYGFTAEQMLSMYRQGMERAAEMAADKADRWAGSWARAAASLADDIRSEAKGGRP